MSKIALSGNASGTGTFTFASPNSNTDRTLDLPDASGVIDRLNRAGNVLQVVQGSTTSGVTLAAGTSFTASNLSASITPTSSSSKVLVLVNGPMYASTSTAEPQGTIYRNSTNVISASSQFTDTFSGAGAIISNISIAYLDSPATTSSTTYTFYFKNSVAGNGTFPVNSGTATIVLMEIAA